MASVSANTGKNPTQPANASGNQSKVNDCAELRNPFLRENMEMLSDKFLKEKFHTPGTQEATKEQKEQFSLIKKHILPRVLKAIQDHYREYSLVQSSICALVFLSNLYRQVDGIFLNPEINPGVAKMVEILEKMESGEKKVDTPTQDGNKNKKNKNTETTAMQFFEMRAKGRMKMRELLTYMVTTYYPGMKRFHQLQLNDAQEKLNALIEYVDIFKTEPDIEKRVETGLAKLRKTFSEEEIRLFPKRVQEFGITGAKLNDNFKYNTANDNAKKTPIMKRMKELQTKTSDHQSKITTLEAEETAVKDAITSLKTRVKNEVSERSAYEKVMYISKKNNSMETRRQIETSKQAYKQTVTAPSQLGGDGNKTSSESSTQTESPTPSNIQTFYTQSLEKNHDLTNLILGKVRDEKMESLQKMDDSIRDVDERCEEEMNEIREALSEYSQINMNQPDTTDLDTQLRDINGKISEKNASKSAKEKEKTGYETRQASVQNGSPQHMALKKVIDSLDAEIKKLKNEIEELEKKQTALSSRKEKLDEKRAFTDRIKKKIARMTTLFNEKKETCERVHGLMQEISTLTASYYDLLISLSKEAPSKKNLFLDAFQKDPLYNIMGSIAKKLSAGGESKPDYDAIMNQIFRYLNDRGSSLKLNVINVSNNNASSSERRKLLQELHRYEGMKVMNGKFQVRSMNNIMKMNLSNLESEDISRNLSKFPTMTPELAKKYSYLLKPVQGGGNENNNNLKEKKENTTVSEKMNVNAKANSKNNSSKVNSKNASAKVNSKNASAKVNSKNNSSKINSKSANASVKTKTFEERVNTKKLKPKSKPIYQPSLYFTDKMYQMVLKNGNGSNEQVTYCIERIKAIEGQILGMANRMFIEMKKGYDGKTSEKIGSSAGEGQSHTAMVKTMAESVIGKNFENAMYMLASQKNLQSKSVPLELLKKYLYMQIALVYFIMLFTKPSSANL